MKKSNGFLVTMLMSATLIAGGILSTSARANQCYEFDEAVGPLFPFIWRAATITLFSPDSFQLEPEIAINRQGKSELHAGLACHNLKNQPQTMTCTVEDDAGHFELERKPVYGGQAVTLNLSISDGYLDIINPEGDNRIAVIPKFGSSLNLNLTRVLSPEECSAKFPEAKPIPVIPTPSSPQP